MEKDQKTETLRKILSSVHEALGNALRLLDQEQSVDPDEMQQMLIDVRDQFSATSEGEDRVVEGVFDGRNMVGDDGQQYSIPPNYASKSKLVEGDRLKLIITGQGKLIYKQIGPVEREHLVAQLVMDPNTHQYVAIANDKKWNLITASITYFRGESGDEVAILVPKGTTSGWAAVDHIIKND